MVAEVIPITTDAVLTLLYRWELGEYKGMTFAQVFLNHFRVKNPDMELWHSKDGAWTIERIWTHYLNNGNN